MALSASVSMAGYTWETGKQIVDVEVVLGSAEKSSSCKIVLSDPDHLIAEACINHSISSGGIQVLQSEKVSPAFTAPVTPSTTPNTSGYGHVSAGANTAGIVATGEKFTPEVKAFADTVAMRETQDAKNAAYRELGIGTTAGDPMKAYYANNSIEQGYFNEADILSGGGYPKSAGKKWNVGRYQFNRLDWVEAKKANPAIKGYSPLDQDLVFLHKIERINRGYKELVAGDWKGAIRKAANEWVSIPGGRQYRPQGEDKVVGSAAILERYYKYYQLRLEYYQRQAKGTTKKPDAVKLSKPVETKAPVAPKATPAATPTPEKPIIKGSVITVTLAGVTYEFIHQGTETSDNGLTTLSGQGLRWLMSRRARNATYKGLSLKQLATKVAKEYKLTLDYQATFDPTYEHLDQSGISDYKLLLREVEANGLMVSEDKQAITIKERAQLKDSKLVLSRGVNLVGYKMTDKAVSSKEDEISQALPHESKTTIDPIEGKALSTKKDVDRNAASGKPTGKAKADTKGTLTSPAEAAKATDNRAATKRVGGLPSTFTLPLEESNLTLEPLSTVLTKGFPGVLDRIWVIKKIVHALSANTTTLELVSPIEVIDSEPKPVVTPTATASAATAAPKSTGKWVYPCSGVCTSAYGWRTHPISGKKQFHGGWDIANVKNTPIYAVDGGVVTFVGDKGFGGGNQIDVKHSGGYGTSYLHNTSILLKVGDPVKQGQQIAFMGTTGGSTGDHLHFTIVKDGQKFDPATIFTKMKKRATIKGGEAV